MCMNLIENFIEKINLNLTRILLIKFIAEKRFNLFLNNYKNTRIMES